MKNSTVSRVQKHRAKLRAMGLRPVQLWVPNTKDPAFIAECRRQSRIVSESDKNDVEMQAFMDAAFADMWADPEWK